jgi:hypothetical protein
MQVSDAGARPIIGQHLNSSSLPRIFLVVLGRGGGEFAQFAFFCAEGGCGNNAVGPFIHSARPPRMCALPAACCCAKQQHQLVAPQTTSPPPYPPFQCSTNPLKLHTSAAAPPHATRSFSVSCRAPCPCLSSLVCLPLYVSPPRPCALTRSPQACHPARDTLRRWCR